MITILLQKILEQVKALKTNIVNIDGRNGFIYSFEEQKIGKWVDGKDLYFKTYHPTGTFSTDNNHWTDLIDLSDLNINYIIDCRLSFSGINELNFNDGRLRYSYSTTTKRLRAASYGGMNVIDPYITIYYTKSETEEE